MRGKNGVHLGLQWKCLVLGNVSQFNDTGKKPTDLINSWMN